MTDIGGFQRLAHGLEAAARAYLADRNESRLEQVRAIRNEIAGKLLADQNISREPALAATLQSIAVSCVNSGVRSVPRNADEQDLMARALASARATPAEEQGAVALPALLMAWHACELTFMPDLASVPVSLLPAWLTFLFERPNIFVNHGDAVEFARYLGPLCAQVRDYLTANPKHAGDVAAAFNASTAFAQSNFNELNLRDTLRSRAAIIELLLERSGATLDQLRVLRTVRSRPRLGFVAAAVVDGSESAFLAAHMHRLDRQKYDVRLYTLTEPSGRLGALCQAAADSCIRLPGNVRDAVARLRLDDLDLAIFANNLTYLNQSVTQIAAHRVARLQAANIASPVTTGLRNMDAMLSGEFNETGESPEHYTESLVCLSGALNCYPFQYVVEGLPAVEPISRAQLGIPDDAILFLSTANFFKLLPEVTALWFSILRRVPNSSLALMPFGPNWASEYPVDVFSARLARQTEDAGVSSQRLHLLPAVPTIAHLHRVVQTADVYLDSFPFSGACSIYDAMEVGIPTVARSGSVCRSRHSKAILEEAGLADWVCADDAAYLERAVELGTDAQKRQDARARLAQARETGLPLTDTAAYAHKLELALDRIFADWNRKIGQVPAPDQLTEQIERLSIEAGGRLPSFTDLDLIQSIALPYLRVGGSRRMIDVGACFGAMAKPFLEEGWRVVLFEPDPRCRQQLAALLAAHPARVQVEAAAVIPHPNPPPQAGEGRERAMTAFHLGSVPGRSGLSTSPHAADMATINVRAIRLADYLVAKGFLDVDFIKIDASGHGLGVIKGLEFTKIAPRLVMVEFDVQFVRQDRDAIDAVLVRMRGLGYRACVVCLDGSERTTLLAIGVDRVPVLPSDARLFGNILFLRNDDRDFLPILLDWLEHACKWR